METTPELDRLRAAAVPDHDRVLAAVRAGDAAGAEAALASLVDRFAGLQDYSVNWVTSLLSFIGRELGEGAVEDALREFGDGYLAERRARPDGSPPWRDLPGGGPGPGRDPAHGGQRGNGRVDADEDRIELSFRCGTGGRLVDEGRYDPVGAGAGRGYLRLQGDGPATFGEPGLPVYCAHCSINNEVQPLERDGVPTTVEFPTRRPGEPCVHHVYRDLDRLPEEVLERLRPPPAPGGPTAGTAAR